MLPQVNAPPLCFRLTCWARDVAMVNPLDDAAIAALLRIRVPSEGVCLLAVGISTGGAALFTASGEGNWRPEMSLASLGIAPKPAAARRPYRRSAPEPPAGTSRRPALRQQNASRASGLPLRSSLICLDGWDLGREIELTGQDIVGQSPDADTTVRRRWCRGARADYAERGVQAETFVITDLHSNGTYVNNIPVTSTILRHGDRVMLGNVLFSCVAGRDRARYHRMFTTCTASRAPGCCLRTRGAARSVPQKGTSRSARA